MKKTARKSYETITCPECQGHGVVARYAFDGSDFEDPAECPTCDGARVIVRYNMTAVLAKYPGGPLLGRESV